MSLHIVLVDPEIPQNTGNIARTCAAIDATLHIVGTPGFSLSDRYLRRAGVDYWHLVRVARHVDLAEFFRYAEATYGAEAGSDADFRAGRPSNLVFTSAHARVVFTEYSFPDRCFLIFGRESTGLPRDLLQDNLDRAVRIPTVAGVRSLNLSNAVAVIAYEAKRQQGFIGLEKVKPDSSRTTVSERAAPLDGQIYPERTTSH